LFRRTRSRGTAAGVPLLGGTKVSWSTQPSEHGTKVVFRHTCFPDDEPDYEFGSVSRTWALIIERLKEVVESGGVPNPALS
jgi:hypothetical protein